MGFKIQIMLFLPASGHRFRKELRNYSLARHSAQKGSIKEFPAHKDIYQNIVFTARLNRMHCLGIKNTDIALAGNDLLPFYGLTAASRPEITKLYSQITVKLFSVHRISSSSSFTGK